MATEARNRVAEIAENAKPLAMQGGDRQSNNFQDYNYNLEKVDKGTSADYLTARIARDHPEVLEGMKQGKYRSVRAAAAGQHGQQESRGARCWPAMAGLADGDVNLCRCRTDG